MILIKCDNVAYKVGSNIILEDISLTVNRGDVITIIGPNGGGKTTLAKIIIGIISNYMGSVNRTPGISIGYTPQKVKLNPLIPITVERFLSLAIKSDNKSKRRVRDLILRNKLENILGTQLHDVSGGELQRVMLTRALLKDTELLVLDEPTQALDVSGQNEFYNFVEELRRKERKTVIIISHDLHTVMKTADQVICLNKRLCCSGTPDHVMCSAFYHKLCGKGEKVALSHYQHRHNNHNHKKE